MQDGLDAAPGPTATNGDTDSQSNSTAASCFSSTNVTDSLPDSVDSQHVCSLCNVLFSAPRVLNCLHVFDLQCLKEADTVECPVCSEVTPVKNGLASLPYDYSMMFDLISKSQTLNNYRLKCTTCVAKDAASSFCLDCPALLCPKSVESHRLLLSFLSHRVLSFEQVTSNTDISTHCEHPALQSSEEQPQSPPLSIPVYCSQHSTQIAQDVCTMCSVCPFPFISFFVLSRNRCSIIKCTFSWVFAIFPIFVLFLLGLC